MNDELRTLAAHYQPSEQGIATVRAARIVLLGGIIAAGKDTLTSQILKLPEYRRIVTHTTRAPRMNRGVLEVQDVDYHFVSFDEMQSLLENKEMIEVNQFGDHFYGTSVAEFQKSIDNQTIAIGDVDVNGVDAFQKLALGKITAIFVVPPHYDEWLRRLKKRYVSDEAFQKEWSTRKGITIAELQKALSLPYYHFLINDDVERASVVVNKIAHRETDFFKRKDDEAKIVAHDLLDAILKNENQ